MSLLKVLVSIEYVSGSTFFLGGFTLELATGVSSFDLIPTYRIVISSKFLSGVSLRIQGVRFTLSFVFCVF